MKCIEPVIYAMYSENMLSSEEVELVERHLSECDECREDYEFANAFLENTTITEWEPLTKDKTRSLWEQIQKKISSVRKWVTASLSELVLQPWFPYFEALARGESETLIDYIYLPKNIRDLKTEMYLKREADKAILKIRVLEGSSGADIFRATLTDDRGEIIASRSLKDDLVIFENLDFDAYTIIFYGHHDQWNYGFEINETGLDEKPDSHKFF